MGQIFIPSIQPKIITGSYSGNGNATQTITILGIGKIKCLLIGASNVSGMISAFAIKNGLSTFSIGQEGGVQNIGLVTDHSTNSIIVNLTPIDTQSLNDDGNYYNFCAWGE
jgi:hypothetical protein